MQPEMHFMLLPRLSSIVKHTPLHKQYGNFFPQLFMYVYLLSQKNE